MGWEGNGSRSVAEVEIAGIGGGEETMSLKYLLELVFPKPTRKVIFLIPKELIFLEETF